MQHCEKQLKITWENKSNFMKDQLSTLRIEPISRHHVRKDFNCGEPDLDEYLRRYARQNDERNIARSFVAIDECNAVIGYYSLSTSSIEFEQIPKEYTKQLPGYPVPAALIGRLAVDLRLAGQGLGSRLLIDALQRIASASIKIAVKVVLVDAIDSKAKNFYLHFGFIELPGLAHKLFLPIETILQLTGQGRR